MMDLTSTLASPSLGLDVFKSLAQESATSASTDKQQDAERALTTVKEVASQSRRNTAAKDAAMQKLTLLKTQLSHLMMFGGDPKTRAREAAQIAKQIGEAAKEYAQAGGSSAEVAAAEPSSASATNTATSASSADASGGASGTTAAAVAPPALEWRTGTVLPAVTGTAGKAVASSSSGRASTASSKTADQAFIAEARLLARQANAIIKAALEEERHPKAKEEIGSEGSKALTAIDNAALVVGLGSRHGIESSVGYSASAQSLVATSPPAIAVTA